MPFIKTKCVLENKTHKAPRLILFKTPPPTKKRQFGARWCTKRQGGAGH